MKLSEKFSNTLNGHPDFSGVVLIKRGEETIFSHTNGHRQRAEELPINANTRFGMASGCKGFTAVAVCQLVEQGKLTFETRLTDIVTHKFPHFDPAVTVHHLLTHTSGVADYFDEEVMDDFGALWLKYPTYTIKSSADFLPLFQNEPQKYPAGEKFAYNNSGYILLGLIVEAASGMSFADYVQKHIFDAAGMADSGYFYMDQLPANTALGYIHDEATNTYRTNIFSVPIVGGSDGGAFVTAPDMNRFWRAFLGGQLVSDAMRKTMLTPHATEVIDGKTGDSYGYGFWLANDTPLRASLIGGDPGVRFFSSYLHEQDLQMTVLCNTDSGNSTAWRVARELVEMIVSR